MSNLFDFIDSKEAVDYKEQQLAADIADNCEKCKLYKWPRTPRMKPGGPVNADYYLIGESPGCISGDSLIEVAFRDKSKFPRGIPIKDLVGRKDFYVYSYDQKRRHLVLGKVKKVWKTGRKVVYRVDYTWQFNKPNKTIKKRDSIKVTLSHLFLLKRYIAHDPYKGVNQEGQDYLSIAQGLMVGYSLQPFYRRICFGYSQIGLVSKTRKESRFLLEFKLGRKLRAGEQCHHRDENKLNDAWRNLELQTIQNHSSLHCQGNRNPMRNPEVREKHREIMQSDEYRRDQSRRMKMVLGNPEVYSARLQQLAKSKYKIRRTLKDWYNSPSFYYRYLLTRQKLFNLTDMWIRKTFRRKFPDKIFPKRFQRPFSSGINNHKIVSIRRMGVQDVYDMEVKRYHNFATNGIFIHNSEEDRVGRQFYEKAEAGKYLRLNMRNNGLNPNLWRMGNALSCRKPENASPTDAEITLCRPRLIKDIQETKPRVIMLFGGPAVQSVIGDKGIGRYRGRIIPYHDLGAWVCPLVHPAGVKRDLDFYESVFQADLAKVAKLVKAKTSLPKIKPYKIDRVTNLNDILNVCQRLEQCEKFAIDFETVNIRPYHGNSKLVSAAVTADGITAASFPIEKSGELIPRQQKRILEALKKPLANPRIRKIVHNLGMECEWSEVYLGVKIAGLVDDTQRMSYALDVRHKCHSLAFITLVNFGIRWKDATARYIRNMDACPIELLLDRGGLDVIWTFRNWWHYKRLLEKEPKIYKMYRELLIPVAKACVDVQVRGALADRKCIKVLETDLDEHIGKQEKKLRAFSCVKRYERAKGKRMNLGSDAQIRDLLYSEREYSLKLKPIKSTKTGYSHSVDASVLKTYAGQGVIFCRELLIYRDVTDQRSTCEGLHEHIYSDGLFHQQLSNAFTGTGRLNSSDPNMQNFRKRDKEYSLSVRPMRGIIIAPKGYVIASFDYEQVEAVGIAIVSGDMNFKNALEQGYDIHLEKAREVFGSREAREKRSLIKNQLVFPSIYLAGPKLVAKGLGISKEQAHRHQEKLWRDFPRIKEYQMDQLEFYKKHGYVETRTGRRRDGPLTVAQMVNTPVQGLGSDFCVRSMDIVILRGYWVWANVHDELNFYLPEESLERDLVRISRVMTGLPPEWTDGFKIRVGCKIGYDWGHLEKITI